MPHSRRCLPGLFHASCSGRHVVFNVSATSVPPPMPFHTLRQLLVLFGQEGTRPQAAQAVDFNLSCHRCALRGWVGHRAGRGSVGSHGWGQSPVSVSAKGGHYSLPRPHCRPYWVDPGGGGFGHCPLAWRTCISLTASAKHTNTSESQHGSVLLLERWCPARRT